MVDRVQYFREFVGRWEKELAEAWEKLPGRTRSKLAETLGALPADMKRWRVLVDQALEHVRLAAGEKSQVAILGPANVGKSTLYNQVVRSPQDRSQVSAVPGTTRQALRADAGLFQIVDTPGADAVGPVGELEKKRALEAARLADVLVVIFDAAHGVRAPERKLFREILLIDKPTVVALNKMDLVPARERPQVIGKAAAALGVSAEQIVALSAKKGEGVTRLMVAVAKAEPEIVAALGAALPAYRWALAGTVIARSASTAAAIALTPLPFLDFIPLIGVQTAMVLAIARIYAYRITLARAREIIAAFGLGLLGRTLFYELSKLSGPPGWLIASAVAAGTTVAMGYAAAAWFERGERLSQEALRRIAQAVSENLVERLKGLGRRRPRRHTLQQSVRQALGEIPLPEEGEAEQ